MNHVSNESTLEFGGLQVAYTLYIYTLLTHEGSITVKHAWSAKKDDLLNAKYL